MTASFYPELTDILNNICDDISQNIIKEGHPIILVDEYSWFREVLSLLAKQVNLCESCILLLENGMEQEAYLLARSQFNNTVWITYLCGDEDNSRVKEYFYQPHINQIRVNKNFIKMIDEFRDEIDERFLDSEMIEKINKGIEENQKILSDEGISKQVKSISELSMQSIELFAMYVTFYNEGSKFEHSDISKTKLYRKEVSKDYDEYSVFTFELCKSDKECWLSVYNCSFMSLFWAFNAVYDRVTTKEEQLFWNTVFGNSVYTKEDFEKIIYKFAICQEKLLKPDENNQSNLVE